jgi:sugar phosphate permease
MRWLILLPAGPGALLGGWIAEHVGLRYALAFAGCMALLISIVAWRQSIIRNMRTLPMAAGPHRAADAQLVPDTQPGEFVP